MRKQHWKRLKFQNRQNESLLRGVISRKIDFFLTAVKATTYCRNNSENSKRVKKKLHIEKILSGNQENTNTWSNYLNVLWTQKCQSDICTRQMSLFSHSTFSFLLSLLYLLLYFLYFYFFFKSEKFENFYVNFSHLPVFITFFFYFSQLCLLWLYRFITIFSC